MERQPEAGESAKLTTDGGCCGIENNLLAGSKNILLATTDLKGSKVSEHWADFEFSENGEKLCFCQFQQ